MSRNFSYGARKSKAPSQPPKREDTAWHEAAHALLCEYFDMRVTWVTCEPLKWKGQNYLGYTMTAAEEDGEPFEITGLQAMYALMQSAAGFVCEWMRGTMKRGYVDPGDMEELTEIAKQIDIEKFEDTEMILGCTEEFLTWSWDVVKDIAERLIARGRIEGTEVREVVRIRLGYIPEGKQEKPFEGLVVVPGSEAATRDPWKRVV
jgi:ATP-dependent Zn protease